MKKVILGLLALFSVMNSSLVAQEIDIERKPIRSEVSRTRIKNMEKALKALEDAEIEGKDKAAILKEATYKLLSIQPGLISKPSSSLLKDVQQAAIDELLQDAESLIKFPNKSLVMQQAEKRFPIRAAGDYIKELHAPTPQRRAYVKGTIISIDSNYIKIGINKYRIREFASKAFRDSLNPALVKRRRAAFLKAANNRTLAERRDYVEENFTPALKRKVAINERRGYVYDFANSSWTTVNAYLGKLVQARMIKVEEAVKKRTEEAEAKAAAEKKRFRAVQKVLIDVSEVSVEETVVVLKKEGAEYIKAAMKAKAKAEEDAEIEKERLANAKKAKEDKARSAKESLIRKQRQKLEDERKQEQIAKEKKDAFTSIMIKVGSGVVLLVIILFFFLRSKGLIGPKKKDVSDIIAESGLVNDDHLPESVEEDELDTTLKTPGGIVPPNAATGGGLVAPSGEAPAGGGLVAPSGEAPAGGGLVAPGAEAPAEGNDLIVNPNLNPGKKLKINLKK